MADVSSGYLQRGIARFPRAGTRGPRTMMAYEKDVARGATRGSRPGSGYAGSFARMDVGI